MIQNLHDKMRRVHDTEIDNELKAVCLSPESGKLAFSPLRNYIEFAGQYGCDIGPESPTWSHDLIMNDGSTLRLTGLNSALISNTHDNKEGNRLVLGEHQLTNIHEAPGVQHLVLCHHPPDWLRDDDIVADRLDKRVHVQLFGHKHRQRISNISNRSVRVVSGALQPQRGEGEWSPGYNLIRMRIEGTSDKRFLFVEIEPREYSKHQMRFVAAATTHDNGVEQFEIPLPAWQPSETGQDDVPETISPETEHVQDPPADDPVSERTVTPERQLTYRFLNLPYHLQMHVIVRLNLLGDEDDGLAEVEVFRRVFQRAQSQGRLAELWDSVVELEGSDEEIHNPFCTENRARDTT